MSKDYGVLLEDQGISLRGLFIINPEGILRQIMNDLPVGRLVKMLNSEFSVSIFSAWNMPKFVFTTDFLSNNFVGF